MPPTKTTMCMAYLNELVEKSFECSHAYVYVHTHTKNSAAFKSNMQAMRMHSPYSHYKTDMHRTEIGMHRPFGHLVPDECGSEVFGPPVWSEILRTCQSNNISRPIIIGPICIYDSRRMTACSSHLSVGRRVVQCLVHVQVLSARGGSARQRRRFKDTSTQV